MLYTYDDMTDESIHRSDEEIMGMAGDHAANSCCYGYGGPFGAAIAKDGKVVVTAANSVLLDKDPTAHAEIVAIRKACKILDTYDLSDYTIYATGCPCPMCLSAIIWSGIKKIKYSGDTVDAERIGFKDRPMYEALATNDFSMFDLEFEQVDPNIAERLYDMYETIGGTIY